MRISSFYSLFLWVLILMLWSFSGSSQEIKDRIDSVELMEDGIEKIEAFAELSEELVHNQNEFALELAQKALKLAISINSDLGFVIANHQIGEVYYRSSDYFKALPFYLKSLSKSEELENYYWIAQNQCNIGLIYYHRDENETALEYFRIGISMSDSIKAPKVKARLLNSTGVALWELKKIAEANEYFIKALNIEIEETGDIERMMVGYNNVGNCYMQLGEYNKAINYLTKGVALQDQLYVETTLSLLISNLGKVKTQQGKFEEADSLLKSAEAMLVNNNNKRMKFYNAQYLTELYEKKGDYKSAFEYQGKLMALSDSMLNESKDKQMAQLSAEFESEKKDSELFKQQIELERQSENQKVYIAVLGFLVIFLITSGYFIRRLRATNKAIEKNRIELASNNTALENAMNELVTTQSQLIQSEKMATLGTLFAGIAHEINTPLSVIKSSAETLITSFDSSVESLKELIAGLNKETLSNLFELIKAGGIETKYLSSNEEREIRKSLKEHLNKLGVSEADKCSGYLISLNQYHNYQDFLTILKHEKNIDLLRAAEQVAVHGVLARNILSSSNKTNRIIYAMRTYSYKGDGVLAETNLKETIETALVLYDNRLKNGIETQKKYDDTPLFISCYPDEITQVWVNLIHNALDAMENNGKLAIDVEEGEMVKVSITDTGKGIQEENKDKIFQPFFTTKSKGEGTGLGLDIVKRIVEKHKGVIEFSTENSVGTTFNVYLNKEI